MTAFRLRFVVTVALAILCAPRGASAQVAASFGSGCASGNEVIEIRLGEGVPLPVSYSNPTDDDVTFTVTMNTNVFFGTGREVHRTVVPAGMGVLTPGRVVPTAYGSAIGKDHVILEVRSDATGNAVLARCDFLVTVKPPRGLEDLCDVPVRFAVIEGSPQAQGRLAGDTVPGDHFYELLRAANAKHWLDGEKDARGAHILFRPARAPMGVPVIADPDETKPPGSVKGDIDDKRLHEPGKAAALAETRWHELYPSETGLIVLNAFHLYQNSFANDDLNGFTPGPSFDLLSGGSRERDLCEVPRRLTTNDVTPLYCVIRDAALSRRGDKTLFSPEDVLAHELGHHLFLGHGNGLDDNSDGTLPPGPGPRLFDQFCDPLPVRCDSFGACVSDEDAGFATLMAPFADRVGFEPLQIELARTVAALVPGARCRTPLRPSALRSFVGRSTSRCPDSPCIPIEVLATRVSATISPERDRLFISHALPHSVEFGSGVSYLAFVDLDGDSSTGCRPSILGHRTSFEGAELVTGVTVRLDDERPRVTPEAWICDDGELVPLDGPNVVARLYLQRDELGIERYGQVSISVPANLLGDMSKRMRIQSLARELRPGGASFRVPENPAGGAVLDFRSPRAPECEFTPVGARPGETVRIDATGLSPGLALLFIGEHQVATAAASGAGVVSATVAVPVDLVPGLAPVEVRSASTGLTAATALLVLADIVVTFDVDQGGAPLRAGADVSGRVLEDLGIRLKGRSGSTGSPGVFTDATGQPGSDTDDLVSVSGLFLTTRGAPGDEGASDYGTIWVDFVDPVSGLPRTVEFAQITFIDVEDSIGVVTAYGRSGGTGPVLETASTSDDGTDDNAANGNRDAVAVGRPGSGLAIASISIRFGSNRDSAAIDQLVFEFTSTGIDLGASGMETGIVSARPGSEVALRLSAKNSTGAGFEGSLVTFLVSNPGDPYGHRGRIVGRRPFAIAAGGARTLDLRYDVPEGWAARHAGKTFRLGHALASPAGFELARTWIDVAIAP